MAQAAQEKEKGNAAFKAGDYPAAIGHYSAAIHADRTDATFPLNRAAAYLKLGKNEDAERDCSTVLTLSKNNVKALFRRAQARVGMGKLSEAQQDLRDAAKLDPANESVKQELIKVTELLRQASVKKSKPVAADVASTSTPKRRRIPITIVEPDGRRITPTTPADGSSKEAKPTPTPPPKSTSPETDLMKPVSSRPLNPSSSSSSTNGPTPPPTKPKSTSPQTPPPNPTPASSSFKDAKTTRDSSKPSRIGGGIFRASGENTIFSARETRPPPQPTQPESETPPAVKQEAPAPSPPVAIPPQISPITPSSLKLKPPMTLFDFTHTWARESTPAARSALLSQIPPPTLPALFQTSLEPSLFVEIVETLALSTGVMDVASAGAVDSDGRAQAQAFMHAFTNVPRFGTVLRFLSRAEKARVRELWAKLLLGVGEGGEGEGRPVQLDRVWDAVYPVS